MRRSTVSLSPRMKRAVLPMVLTVAAMVMLVATPAQAILGSVSANWPAAKVNRGSTVKVTGHVSGIELSDGVFLQQKVLGGWRNVSRAKLDSQRNYTLAIPTWWLGTRTYRVMTASLLDTTILGTASTAWTVEVVPTYNPAGVPTQHTWTSSTYMRWNPCQTIGYRVNAREATKGAVSDVKGAMKRLSQATGYHFAYRGTTSNIPQAGANSWYPKDTQIVVAWARPSQSSMFDGYSGAAAMGGAISSGGYQAGDGTTLSKIIRGAVVINATQKYAAGFGSGYTRGDILLHELGHTMGMGHTSATSQIMYKTMTRSAARYNEGDLTALESRGARLGCITAIDFSSLRTEPTHMTRMP